MHIWIWGKIGIELLRNPNFINQAKVRNLKDYESTYLGMREVPYYAVFIGLRLGGCLSLLRYHTMKSCGSGVRERGGTGKACKG